MPGREFGWERYTIVGRQEMSKKGPTLESGFNRLVTSGFASSGKRLEDLFVSAGMDPTLPRFVSILKREWNGHPRGRIVLQTVEVPRVGSFKPETYQYELAIEV